MDENLVQTPAGDTCGSWIYLDESGMKFKFDVKVELPYEECEMEK